MRTHVMGRSLVWAVLALSFTVGAIQPVSGQGVTYVTVSKPEMAGAMGMMARMAPGAMAETRVTTSVEGNFVRTDDADRTSTILDWAEGRFTFLNHEDRTWYSMSLDEMMSQATMGASAMSGEAGSMPDIQVERTGRTQEIEGFTAEQVLMFVIPPPADEEEATEGAPTMAVVVDMWLSKDFPGHEAFTRAQEAMAGQAGAGMSGAFAMDPAMAEAGQRIAEEMKGMEGVPVRTVTSMVMVPPGSTLDRETLLAEADKPLGAAGPAGGGLDAARQALGGMLGRRRQQQAPPDDSAVAAGPSVCMRITQVVEEVRVGSIPEDRFQVPAGYQEAPPVR